jgi:hypothetical protein
MTPELTALIETAAKLKELEAKATKGPWEYDGMHNEITTPRGDSYWLLVSECRNAPDQACQLDDFGHGDDKNFELIAKSRNALPAFLALPALLAEALDALDGSCSAGGRCPCADGCKPGICGQSVYNSITAKLEEISK